MATQKSNSVTEAQAELLREYFAEIACACHTLRELGIEVVSESKDDPASIMGVSIREIAAKTGFLADQCSRILGAVPFAGDWQEWMLPPTARDAFHRASTERSSGHEEAPRQ